MIKAVHAMSAMLPVIAFARTSPNPVPEDRAWETE
jgi:hypothetical protein